MRNFRTVYSIETGQPQTSWESPLEPGVFLQPPNTTEVEPPEFDPETQYAVFEDDEWIVRDIPKRTISNDEIVQRRFLAYIHEADPLYFKWQREECTKEDWLNKVEEIRQRYPKTENDE